MAWKVIVLRSEYVDIAFINDHVILPSKYLRLCLEICAALTLGHFLLHRVWINAETHNCLQCREQMTEFSAA